MPVTFIKIDVEDLFSSWEMHGLVADAVGRWEQATYRELVTDCLFVLLYNQFVASDRLPQWLWRVVHG